MLEIRNPADGTLLSELAEDDESSVRAKVQRAQAAQGPWAATLLPTRLSILARFRALLVERRAELALMLTWEVGKPITQSFNELKGVMGRIDFFLENVTEVTGERTVFHDADRGVREAITHEPLGIVANIWAWNYPYFVGANVFVPALLAGNSVVYFALSGLADRFPASRVFAVCAATGAIATSVSLSPRTGSRRRRSGVLPWASRWRASVTWG